MILSLNRRGDLTIESVIIMILVLLLLIALLIYSGVLQKQSASLFDTILRFITGR